MAVGLAKTMSVHYIAVDRRCLPAHYWRSGVIRLLLIQLHDLSHIMISQLEVIQSNDFLTSQQPATFFWAVGVACLSTCQGNKSVYKYVCLGVQSYISDVTVTCDLNCQCCQTAYTLITRLFIQRTRFHGI